MSGIFISHSSRDREAAEAITMHERLRRLEFGARRGFGSVKVIAAIGDTRWKTSVFPSKTGEWWLLAWPRDTGAAGDPGLLSAASDCLGSGGVGCDDHALREVVVAAAIARGICCVGQRLDGEQREVRSSIVAPESSSRRTWNLACWPPESRSNTCSPARASS